MSKAQVDRLGQRLRAGMLTEQDLRDLTKYRDAFESSYRRVFAVVREGLGIEPTGRPAKSTGAIIEKLRRESIRLSQVQDIAGLRVVTPSIAAQDFAIACIEPLFDEMTAVDRRARPSHGYRAVHLIVFIDGTPVEIQIRTALQHRWAELSEKLSDRIDPSIKYGGGAEWVREILNDTAALVSAHEEDERALASLEEHIVQFDDRERWQAEMARLLQAQSHDAGETHALFDFVLTAVRRMYGDR